jgi:hypothetical protein
MTEEYEFVYKISACLPRNDDLSKTALMKETC